MFFSKLSKLLQKRQDSSVRTRSHSLIERRRKAFRKVALEQLEERRVLTLPFGALADDTAEFMLGSVVVTPVFFESNGSIDANREDWTPATIEQTLAKIREATNWWVQTLANLNTVHQLSFTIDTTFANNPVQTGYEPISRRSNDYTLYVTEFLTSQGAQTTSIDTEMLKFNNSQRLKFGTDWAFTIIVPNSYNQGDGQFAPGGSFNRAFAFPGGLFMVVPSSRPASTFAHETGHIFWARDEYAGGGTTGVWGSRRGYYNAPNNNAIDLNPDPNFVQQPSIMSAGQALETAWQQNISSPFTLAQIGWRDSDGDGIFDVLDVPLQLSGVGFLDLASGKFRFKGDARVQTMPNLNSWGYRSDITINRISEIQVRFDDGPWQVHSQPNVFEANLDLEITVPSGASRIEIRARDSRSTVTSNLFRADLARAGSTEGQGIQGFVWVDTNRNGLRDAGEYGQAGWTVALVDGSGQPVTLRRELEPNTMADGPVGSNIINGVTLRSVGPSTDGRVGVMVDQASGANGNKVFSAFSLASQSFVSNFTELITTGGSASGRQFQATFLGGTTTVSLDAIGIGANSYGRMEAFSSTGQLLGRYTTRALSDGQRETMTISRGSSEISYIIAYGTGRTSVKLDSLRYGASSTVQTGEAGHYYFPALPEGQYRVQVTAPAGFAAQNPTTGQRAASVTANTATTAIDFGFSRASSQWQNPRNRYDVNDTGFLSASDALLVINALNNGGNRMLTGTNTPAFPFIDVSGEGLLTPTDALLVINQLNLMRGQGGAAGEGESPATKTFAIHGMAGGAEEGVAPLGLWSSQQSARSGDDHLWVGGFCWGGDWSPPLGGGQERRKAEGEDEEEILQLLALEQLAI